MSKQGLGIKMYFRKYLLGFGGKNGQRYLGMDNSRLPNIPLAPFGLRTELTPQGGIAASRLLGIFFTYLAFM